MHGAIVRSVDGELAPREALRLARHLSTCTACRIVLARETRLAAVLENENDAVSVDESFFQAVMASLPELSAAPSVEVSRKSRWRRGLRLASWASLAVLGAGIAGRVLPSLHLDLATPVLPRFTPDDTGGWISLLGTAAQWVRMTAQSIAWAGASGNSGPFTIGALFACAALAGGAAFLALSGAVAWAARTNSRAS
jgi:anti-sigma factor RsiW